MTRTKNRTEKWKNSETVKMLIVVVYLLPPVTKEDWMVARGGYPKTVSRKRRYKGNVNYTTEMHPTFSHDSMHVLPRGQQFLCYSQIPRDISRVEPEINLGISNLWAYWVFCSHRSSKHSSMCRVKARTSSCGTHDQYQSCWTSSKKFPNPQTS